VTFINKFQSVGLIVFIQVVPAGENDAEFLACKYDDFKAEYLPVAKLVRKLPRYQLFFVQISTQCVPDLR